MMPIKKSIKPSPMIPNWTNPPCVRECTKKKKNRKENSKQNDTSIENQSMTVVHNHPQTLPPQESTFETDPFIELGYNHNNAQINHYES